MKILAIIPARSGSKRLPGKNFRECAGKLLVQWSVEACATEWDAHLVTDTGGQHAGHGILNAVTTRLCMMVRPPHLAEDDAPTAGLVAWVLYSHERPDLVDAILLLQPTSPCRTVEQIHNCARILDEHPACPAVVTSRAGEPNGGIYLIRRTAFEKYLSCEPPGTLYVEMDTGPDIDTQADFDEAERILRARHA